MQTLRRDEGRWPLLREYRTLARKDRTLPSVDDIVGLYGSWTKASEDVLDPRTPEGWDLDAIYADYLAGTTQAEIADQLGVSPETVRQVFMRAGLRKRTRTEINAVMSERSALKAKEAADLVRDEVVAAYRDLGLLKETSEATGVGYDLVRKILSEEGILRPPRAWSLATRKRVISARDASRILNAASKAFGGRVSANGYDDLAPTRVLPNGQPWPKSHMTLMRALGTRTWNETLQKVGLPAGRSPGARSTNIEPCFRIIRQLNKRFGRPPVTREYDEVAAGRGVILSQALELHFGWRWKNVLEAAGVPFDSR